MKRRILVVLLGIGTVAGFASGVAGLKHRGEHRQQVFEHLTQVCADAAIDGTAAGVDATDADGWGHHDRFRRFEARVAEACAERASERGQASL